MIGYKVVCNVSKNALENGQNLTTAAWQSRAAAVLSWQHVEIDWVCKVHKFLLFRENLLNRF